MKKIVTFSVIMIALFASCKKSNSSSSYQISASVDGTSKNFNIATIASRTNVNGVTMISIQGIASTSTGENFEIDVSNGPSSDSIVAGNYSDTSSNFNVSGVYMSNATTEYDAGTMLAYDASNTGTTLTNHLKLTITSMDKTSIRGTFSGDFYFNDDISAAKKTITSGNFYAKFQ